MPTLIYAFIFTLFMTFGQFGAIPISNFIQKSLKNDKVTAFNHQNCKNETCGSFQVSFPFYINNVSCGWSNNPPLSNLFQLTCINSTSPYLNIDSQNYRVLEFFDDGVLVDFPGFSNTCRPYNDLNSFGFKGRGNDCFGISSDNVIGLYDCEDSFLCKANCEANDLPGCDRNGNGSGPACCYPLADHSVWHIGDDFDVFSKFECRGFSSWVVPRGMNSGKRGVKLEWAFPMNSSQEICDVNAHKVNATTVKHGFRCLCNDGFVGDGYVNSTGCLKSCFKDGKEEFGTDCEAGRHSRRKMIILAGVLTSALALASLFALLCMIKRSVKCTAYGCSHKPEYCSTLSFRKSCNTRLFTLHELDEATNGFNDEQKVMESCGGSVFTGTLKDGCHIAVQRVKCENEKELMQVLTRVQLLSTIMHRNLAHIFGCCIDSGYSPMVVYEFPENGTLQHHLHKRKDQNIGLDWYKRLSISAQTASLLAFLQHEVSPPVSHHNLKTSTIFLDLDFNVKLACFGLFSDINLYNTDVYELGVFLLEIISGSTHIDMPTIAFQKTRDGKLEEIVDPLLYYHEQPPYRREQIHRVADIAMRCLLFGGDGKLRMLDVAQELVHITKDSIDGGSRWGPALEETFSNSSLLQMISVSPDSIYVP
ncbi:probably inactive receptor-like protein kinase At2g46850 [Amaranthus tricolor]|uniref:probably inactive receptor-like protein kinase At2g46850 n=1 Tax=Amaranthus tricolor TaxID=29722 RepID=UPI0025843B84|nr:probably inactive receptor-like protein kinase At2g46850 [Amaranthus tricolor]